MRAPPSWSGDRGGHLWPKDRETVTTDGVRVRYTVRGPTDSEPVSPGPPVVLCAGYCCPDNFWWYLAPALEPHHRVVMLNYRGVGASTTPRPPDLLGANVRSRDYTMARHADDVLAVCDAEDIDAATFVGHSMGCQVALEVFRAAPDRVASLVFVTGPFESPFRTFYGSTLPTLNGLALPVMLFPPLYVTGKLAPEPLWRLIPRLARLPRMLDVAQLVRAIGPETPREQMAPYLEHFANLDAGVALRIARGMHRHSARDLLAEVDRPALVIVGSDDTFSPPSIGKEFVEHLPDAELVEIPGGTHCALLEYPDRVNAAVLDFLDRRVAVPPVAGTVPTG